MKKIIYFLVLVFNVLSCKENKTDQIKLENSSSSVIKENNYKEIKYLKREYLNGFNIFEYQNLSITLKYDGSTFLGVKTNDSYINYKSEFDLDLGEINLLRFDNSDSSIYVIELDDYNYKTYHFYYFNKKNLYYLGVLVSDLTKIIEDSSKLNILFNIEKKNDNIYIEQIINNITNKKNKFKIGKPLIPEKVSKHFDPFDEKNKTDKTKSVKTFESQIFNIYVKKDGSLDILVNDTKYTNNTILDGVRNCPDLSLSNIVIKDNYFTVEKYNCTDKHYLKEYITFKYLKEEVILHKYSLEFTERKDPDKIVPLKHFTTKDFGIVNFEDVNVDFLTTLRNKK